jgi:hypothetical protein
MIMQVTMIEKIAKHPIDTRQAGIAAQHIKGDSR